MKKRTILLLLSIVMMAVSCKDNAASKIKENNLQEAKKRDAILAKPPIAEFDTTEYDFGTITEGENTTGVFKITNKGLRDLVVISAKGSCGCTVPEWPKEGIKPGETADIKFTFNSSGRAGKQSKTITLKTNTKTGTERLRIKGFVKKKKK